jgi:hypothetical protein
VSEVDTMRWGDTQTLLLANVVATGEGSVVKLQSSQMLNAHWQRPCVWRLMLSINPAIAGNATTLVTVLLRVGVGQANQLTPLATFLATTASGPSVLFFDIPAENIQVQFTLGPVGGVITNGDQVTVSAFVAPHSEPAGIVQIRDVMGQGIREPDRDGLPRFMPAGFEDGELIYRPR